MGKTNGKVLVVDDNAGIRSALEILLPFSQVHTIATPNQIMEQISSFLPDVILLDMNFHTDINSGNEGLFWLQEIKKRDSTIEVVLFTAYADIALAVEGIKRGAYDFIVKPWDNEKLIEILRGALKQRTRRLSPMKARELSQEERMLWGGSPSIVQLRRAIERIAPTDASVLITGENGTGKDVLAREIHRLSSRCSFPMVSVDVGAIPETLFESELFGHVKGAFTDAHTDRKGFFEQAAGGTLFLDEIGNIPLHLQAKLLRVLQSRSINRVGESNSIPIDIRLICATNKNLEQMVASGEFRQDLYYRINTVYLTLPPLRERIDEIEPLCNHFIAIYARKYRREAKSLSAGAAQMLAKLRWSGNIRELQNCMEKLVILSDGEYITDEQVRSFVGMMEHSGQLQPLLGGEERKKEELQTLEQVEEAAIRKAMEKYGDNLSMVAKSLNISRPTLYSKLKKYNI